MTENTDNEQPSEPKTGDTGTGDTGTGDAAAAQAGEQDNRRFRIQKLFLKDVSFESPAAPAVFSRDNASEPKISLQLNTEQRQVGEDLYEVVLIATVTSADDEKTVFLVEVKQAGLFEISGFSDMERAHALGSYCPGILFPYAREVVGSLVQKGGFPSLALQPINFDLLFAQQIQRQREQRDAASTDDSGDGAAATPNTGQ